MPFWPHISSHYFHLQLQMERNISRAYLEPNTHTQLEASVFHLKLNKLIDLITKCQIFELIRFTCILWNEKKVLLYLHILIHSSQQRLQTMTPSSILFKPKWFIIPDILTINSTCIKSFPRSSSKKPTLFTQFLNTIFSIKSIFTFL